MISTPRRRASFRTSFIRGAISATRSVAPLHQCWFHMSQTTSAVRFGSHCTVLSTVHRLPLPLEDSTQERVCNSSGSAQALSKLIIAKVQQKNHFNRGNRFIIVLSAVCQETNHHTHTMLRKRPTGERKEPPVTGAATSPKDKRVRIR